MKCMLPPESAHTQSCPLKAYIGRTILFRFLAKKKKILVANAWLFSCNIPMRQDVQDILILK